MPLGWVTAGGMLVAAGLVLVAAVLRPAAPNLTAAMAQLSAAPVAEWPASQARERPRSWLPVAVLKAVDSYVGVSDADLAILEMSRAQLAARAASGAAVGVLMPVAVSTLFALAGKEPSLVVPAGFTVALAITLWMLPIRETRQKAARARREFGTALRSFLSLVAQERAARGSPAEALEESSRPWRSWPFQLIHDEVLRAELGGEPPWQALGALGNRIGVGELRGLADIVSTAADGAAVFDTLLAEARSLRHAEMAAQQARANATSERLVQPLALLAIGFLLLVLTPPLLRLYTT